LNISKKSGNTNKFLYKKIITGNTGTRDGTCALLDPKGGNDFRTDNKNDV
jgi:hypothetical protein